VPETAYDVIIYHAYCLHERLTNGRSNKFKSPLNQILAHGIGLRGAGGNIRHLSPGILERFAINELPDVTVETSIFFLYLQKSPGVSDRRVNLVPVSYDLRIGEQPGYFLLRVFGDFPGIEIIKSLR